MKLSQLLTEYSPVYPESRIWADTLSYMHNDPYESEILRFLVEDLQKHGSFRQAVTLSEAEPVTDGEDEETASVTDGTHRVCAYMVVGDMDAEVYTRMYDDPYAYEADEEDRLSLYSTEIIFSGVESHQDLSENEQDILFTCLRSFPLTDDIWMTSSTSSMSKNRMHVMWDVDLEGVALETVTAKIRKLLDDAGFTDRVASVETIVEWDDEDEGY